jgi:4-hydroxybenzoate polyprenyltransferase
LERAWSIISRRVYRIIRILSLDILAGVFCGYTFARLILDSECPPLTPAILCLTVWLIYTLDHLLDARALKEKSGKPAYRWHYDNRKILWPILLAAGIATVGLSLVFLSPRILIFGCIMGILVVLYTLVHQGMLGSRMTYLFKESWISIIYTAGIWGVPLLSYGAALDIPVLLTIIIYLLLVLINVLIYSYHDYHTDSQESQQTLATVFGRKSTSHLLRLLILSILILVMVAFLTLDDQAMGKVYIILLSMTAVLGLIIAFPRFFSKNERYGVLADAVFLLPGLLVWIW